MFQLTCSVNVTIIRTIDTQSKMYDFDCKHRDSYKKFHTNAPRVRTQEGILVVHH